MRSLIYLLWLAGLAAPVLTQSSTSPAAPRVTADSLGGSNYLGCYVDTSNRALSGPMTELATNTIETCHSHCVGEGYTLFGVQYSSQCFCGNNITSGGHDPADESQCNYACSGNSSETCGGYWRMNIYKLIATSSSLIQASSSSAPSSSSSILSLASNSAISTSGSSAKSSVVPSVTADPLGASYLGCYTDTSDRALASKMTDLSTNSIENCHTYCADQGYNHFGVEYGSQCFCGNGITPSHTNATQSDCNYACSGKQNEVCGGYWRIGVYQIRASSSSAMPSASITSSPLISSISTSSFAVSSSTTSVVTSSAGPSATLDSLGASYIGCHQDTADRALSGPMTEGNDITIEGCHSWCLSQGYKMFGVEYSTQCFCGHEIAHPAAHPPAYQQSECNWPCSGNSTEECGGYWRIGIYSILPSSSSSGSASLPSWTASSTPSLPTQTDRQHPAEHVSSSPVHVSPAHTGISPSQSSSLTGYMSSVSIRSETHSHRHTHISSHIKVKSSTSSVTPVASSHTSTRPSTSSHVSSKMSSHTSSKISSHTSSSKSIHTSTKPSISIHTSQGGSSSSSKNPTSNHPKTTTSPSSVCQRYIAARDKVTKQVALLKSEKKPVSDGITGQWSALTDSTAQQNCQLAQIEKVQRNGLPLGAFMVWYQGVFEQIGASSGVSC